ncbi:MAG: HAMP domain-containing histidine kinase [Microthrixaceae bacterium]|nr:HAMP domain-containing histidine kinase [Microthrixaceae bacterium]
MNRRIAQALVGAVVVSLALTAVGTFLVARVANRSQELRRLEATAERTNELFVAVDAALLRAGRRADAAGAESTFTQLRRQLLAALSVSGVGRGAIGPNGNFIGELPDGVEANVLDLDSLRAGETISGQFGNTLWAAAGRAQQKREDGRETTMVTVLTSKRERLFGPTFRWFAGSAAVAILVAAAVSAWLARRLAAPVRAAVATTTRIARGDLQARLPEPPGDDELAVLARSINAMGDGLQRARDQERQFLLSVSHDLRTPLTSIRGYAEAIADGAAPDPAAAAAVIIGESRRLERLVGDLLDLARLDVDRFELHPTEADVTDVVAGVLTGLAHEAAAAGVELHHRLDTTAPMHATVDVDRLAQVVANLTANAIGFARSGVWVEVRSDKGNVVIEISDDGPGIAAAELPHVFDRLYQADNQPARRGRGTGLGLAIVAELCARMGGSCGVKSVEGSGTTFVVRLP